MHGERVYQPGHLKDPQHLPLRRGQEEITPSMPGIAPHPDQGRYAARVDELQGRQVNDDHAPTRRHSTKLGHDARGIHHIKLPAQRHDHWAARLTGTRIYTGPQIHTEHVHPSCFSSKAGSGPGGKLTSFQALTLRPTPAPVSSGNARGRVTVTVVLEPGQRLCLVKFVTYIWSAVRSGHAMRGQVPLPLPTHWSGGM